MPFGMVGKEELAREVAAALGDWTPTQNHDQEAAFRDELQEYLSARLNAGGGRILHTSGNFVVERAYGDLECDVVVSGTLGITLKRDLTADQINRLGGKIREFQKAYTHVVVIACGSIENDAWEQLKNAYENQQGMNNDPGSTPIMFLRRREASYGKGDTAGEYPRSDEQNTRRSIVQTTTRLLQNGVDRLRSLRGDR
jgi:hypothetical protein